jgi:hypothetical protein
VLAAIVAALTNLTGTAPTVGAPTYPANILPVFQPPFTFPAVASQLASGGHALYPNKATAAKDANGYYLTSVQYDGDPYTYSYYSQYTWLSALSPAMNAIGISLPPQMLTPALLSNFDALKNGPLPIAKFKNPITGVNWGLWVTMPSLGTEGTWNTNTDHPFGAAVPSKGGSTDQWGGMQIAVAPIPQETFWDQVMDVLDWIPTELGELTFVLSDWMSAFVCSLAGQTSMLNNPALKANPTAMAAALGALAIANAAQCGGPSPVPPPPAVTPITTPWWQQWWVLAAAGLGIWALLSNKKKSRAEEPIEIPAEGISGAALPPPPVYHTRKGPPPGVPVHPSMLKGRRGRRGYVR